MALYFDVRRHNVPNYLGARKEVPSQLNCDNWDIALMGYSDHEICDFLRYGWPISYSVLQIPQATKKNHSSAREFDQDVSAFIHKECKLGAMLGPFESAPFDTWCHTSPLMTRPKKDADQRRVIIDLSYPEGKSVNAGIQKNFYLGKQTKYTLPTILDLVAEIVHVGPGSYMWKCDLARAYRQMRLDPLAYPLMGIIHKDMYYIDICPAFGCRISGGSQQRISNALCYLMSLAGYKVLAYVDDFCGVGATEEEAMAGFKEFQRLCDHLGMVLAPEKSAPPAQSMEWLGFNVDSVSLLLTVPKDKLSALLEEGVEWMVKDKATRSELQSLTGKLSHVSQCIVHSRKFMSRILATLRRAPKYGKVTLDVEMKLDVAWFLDFATLFNGVLLIQPSMPIFDLECDACLRGGGGFSSAGYYSFRFPKKLADPHHISRLEAVNVIVAVYTLVPDDLTAARLVIKTDNSATAHVLSSGRTRDPIMASCARALAMRVARLQLTVDIIHVPGESLQLADALSRRSLSKKMQRKARRMVRQKGLKKVDPVGLTNLLDVSLAYRRISE